MDNCFWNLGKERVLLALKKGTEKMKKGKNMRWGVFRLLGSEKIPDRPGKASFAPNPHARRANGRKGCVGRKGYATLVWA